MLVEFLNYLSSTVTVGQMILFFALAGFLLFVAIMRVFGGRHDQ